MTFLLFPSFYSLFFIIVFYSDITTQCNAGGPFVPSFEDAVRVAKEKNSLIVMDMKAEGLVPEIKRILEKYDFYNVIASARTEQQVYFI